MGKSNLSGWRRRIAAHLINLERISDFLVTQKGEEEYATGVADALDYMYTILAYEEKQNNYFFDNSDIRPPAILQRFAKYEQVARAEVIAAENQQALAKLADAGTEVAKDDTASEPEKKST